MDANPRNDRQISGVLVAYRDKNLPTFDDNDTAVANFVGTTASNTLHVTMFFLINCALFFYFFYFV